jgi:hypothetical protein
LAKTSIAVENYDSAVEVAGKYAEKRSIAVEFENSAVKTSRSAVEVEGSAVGSDLKAVKILEFAVETGRSQSKSMIPQSENMSPRWGSMALPSKMIDARWQTTVGAWRWVLAQGAHFSEMRVGRVFRRKNTLLVWTVRRSRVVISP